MFLNLLDEKTPYPDGLSGQIHQIFKEEITLQNLFRKKDKRSSQFSRQDRVGTRRKYFPFCLKREP